MPLQLSAGVLVLATHLMAFAGEPKCAGAAVERSKQLLAFHFGPDDRIEVDRKVKELSPMPSPVNPNENLEVLELWGYVYKGRYRIRMIYDQTSTVRCVLMGEEILDFGRR